MPVRVDDVVEGGPLRSGEDRGERGVVVGHQTRLGRVSLSRPRRTSRATRSSTRTASGSGTTRTTWSRASCCCARARSRCRPCEDVEAKVEELNETPGRLLPGVQIEPYYDRTDLIDVTTETVRENLLVGMVLVTVILLMFLSNVRTALIVAINIPLALLFAFAVLFLRGKSANLLSIGAVDFGIIVDSLGHHGREHLPPPQLRRARRAAAARSGSSGPRGEVERSLFFSTIIMVCALLPLFTMTGAGRADLRADGRHLRLRPGRRAAAGPDALAGAVPAASSAT